MPVTFSSGALSASHLSSAACTFSGLLGSAPAPKTTIDPIKPIHADRRTVALAMVVSLIHQGRLPLQQIYGQASSARPAHSYVPKQQDATVSGPFTLEPGLYHMPALAQLRLTDR